MLTSLGTLGDADCCERFHRTVFAGVCVLSGTLAIAAVSAWFFYDKMTSVSAGIASIVSFSLLHAVRKLHLTKSIAKSAATLQIENHKLHSSVMQLDEDLSMFKQVIGAVGEQSSEILDRFREMYKNLKSENERHALLIKAQARMHFLTLLKHFDANNDAVLSGDEIQRAKSMLLTSCPSLDVTALIKQAQLSNGIEGADLQRILSEHFV